MAIISYGRMDKKLFLILFLFIVRTIYRIAMNEFPDDYSDGNLCALEEDIGTIILGIIIYFLFKQKLKRTTEDKRSFIYIIILFLLFFVKNGFEYTYSTFVKNSKYYRYYTILNATNGIEIILMSIGTFILLNYKYYIHHMISMSIYCALGISIELILENFTRIGYKYVYIFIIYIINEILIFCYLKYMMDKLYYPLTEVILYYGICELLAKIIIFSGKAIYQYNNDIEGIIDGIKTYFQEASVLVIIFFQFIYILLDGALTNILKILIIYYLRPNLLIVTDEINVLEGIVLYGDNPNRFYTLIPFVIQIFVMLFYFEILELNFCNLNENTAKNIEMREENERQSRSSCSSLIELEEQYYVKDNGFKNREERGSDASDKIGEIN